MTELERKVLETIERRNLAPRPAYLFFAKRSVFWSLAILSIVLGALSVAVLLFAISDYYATGWRTFDNLPLDDLIASIPAFWLVSMPFFIASAYYGVRRTRRGYRFRPVNIVALCLAASIGLGVMFHFFEAGRLINDFLAAHIASYREQTDVPFDKWSRPDQGYLGGHADELLDAKTLRLTDFQRKAWTVDISAATVTLDGTIEEEGDVAIRGTRTGPSSFRAETIEAFD
jgi:hypothetical protein